LSWTGTLIFVPVYPLDLLIFNQTLTPFELLLVNQSAIIILEVENILVNQGVIKCPTMNMVDGAQEPDAKKIGLLILGSSVNPIAFIAQKKKRMVCERIHQIGLLG
jgi:hypothetical protein